MSWLKAMNLALHNRLCQLTETSVTDWQNYMQSAVNLLLAIVNKIKRHNFVLTILALTINNGSGKIFCKTIHVSTKEFVRNLQFTSSTTTSNFHCWLCAVLYKWCSGTSDAIWNSYIQHALSNCSWAANLQHNLNWGIFLKNQQNKDENFVTLLIHMKCKETC